MMAQVEMQCGPFTVVSLMSADAVRELGARAGQRRCRRRQGHHRDRRNYWRAIVKQLSATGRLRCAVAGAGRRMRLVEPRPPVHRAPLRRPRRLAAAGGKIMVFAAASLKKTFTDIGEQFKTDNPGSSVEFSFAGSSDLVTQLTQGAQADVFASADTNNMDKAAQAGLLAGDPVNFASNTLTIAVAPGNPKKIALVQGPDTARPQRGRLRAAGAVRVGDPESRASHRCDAESSQRGVVGYRRPQQGDHRPGRRRSRCTSPTRRAPATRSPRCRFRRPPTPSTPIRSLC